MRSFAFRMRSGVIAAGMLFAGSFQMMSASPAGAAAPLQCQISMQIIMKVVPLTEKVEYTVSTGGGSCFADGSGTYVANILSGTGKSKGFGPGDACPSNETRNFSLDLTVALTSTSTGLVRTVTETFDAPGVAAVPGTTAVTVTSPGKTDGAGQLSYRIFHQCPPGGENSAMFAGVIAN